jgi:ATP-dependent Clp protease ATP-binding subunit ClpC
MVLTGFVKCRTLILMFERFTNRARHVVVLSQEEARKLQHNYIGTEHILLGLLAEPDGIAGRALTQFGMSLEGARDEVKAVVGIGSAKPSGHIPFTPRAKKTLELALREALGLSHNYIGTEHILLGIMREGDGVGAKVIEQHGDPAAVRAAVLETLAATSVAGETSRSWLRRQSGESRAAVEQVLLSATPAGDKALSEAARLAGALPVGSHHLLLAALADPDTAAARALAGLGVDLDRAKAALRTADVTGTSDELPEEAGRRQLVIRVTNERVTLEATDPVIIKAGLGALKALGDQADPPGTIRGDLPVSAGLSAVWQALLTGLLAVQRAATPAPEESASEEAGQPGKPGSEAA